MRLRCASPTSMPRHARRQIGRKQRQFFERSKPPWRRFRAPVKFLSSDLLEGRGTGQRGGDIAADGLATPFACYRCAGWCLPLLLTTSASRSNCLTRLKTPPARSPVSTLRRRPYEQFRMTRGRCGSPTRLRILFHSLHLAGLTGAQRDAK